MHVCRQKDSLDISTCPAHAPNLFLAPPPTCHVVRMLGTPCRLNLAMKRVQKSSVVVRKAVNMPALSPEESGEKRGLRKLRLPTKSVKMAIVRTGDRVLSSLWLTFLHWRCNPGCPSDPPDGQLQLWGLEQYSRGSRGISPPSVLQPRGVISNDDNDTQ